MNKLFKNLLFLLVAMAASMRVAAGNATSTYANYYNGVLTFYHDTQAFSRPGTNYYWGDDSNEYGWLTAQKTTIKKVVFDSSFKDYKRGSWSYMCYELVNLTTVEGTENLNLSNVKSMIQMFGGCKSLTTIDVSNWNVSSVTTMSSMFYNCQSLENIDVSNWNVSNVTDMYNMFCNCKKLKKIDVSKWNVSHVTSMENMFKGSGIVVMDLGNWNTSSIKNTSHMFENCESLTTIYSEYSFNTSNIEFSTEMFLNCFNLVGERGTKYNPSYVDFTYARIDGGTGNPGYFTSRSIPIDAAHFPDANFRIELKGMEIGEDNKLTVDEIFDTEDLDLDYTGEMEDLTGIGYFTELEYLNFNYNKVKYADLSRNTKLKSIYCVCNELYDETMDYLVAHLPKVGNARLYVYDSYHGAWLEREDHNEMTPEQVAAANQKGWTVKVWDENIGNEGEWSETQGFWQINEERFPDENFRRNLLENGNLRCMGILTKEDVEVCSELDLGGWDISDLTGIEYFSALEYLYFTLNNVKTADLSHNTSLIYITCHINQISGANMDFFVNHLPFTNNGIIHVYDGSSSNWPDANEMTPEQVAIANQKGWKVKIYDETQGYHGDWAETQGIWLISEERFPDENFRSYLSSRYPICTGAITYEETMEDEMLPCNSEISDLTGIELFIGLVHLDCSCNRLTSLDLSGNENLRWVDCSQNRIKGSAMDNFIASLCIVPRGEDEGQLHILNDADSHHPEGNEVTAAQVEAAKRRGWIMYAYEKGNWVEYHGPTPTGIISSPIAQHPAPIYDLQGRRIDTRQSSNGTLRKGVYIEDGKKVLVK
jgi:surface protein